MAGYVYYNGVFDKRERITIPLSDRSFFFGDGIYDMAIGCGGKIYQADMHIDRFMMNADRLGIKHEYTHDEIMDLLLRTVGRSGYDEYTVYFQLSRTKAQRIHSAKGTSCALMIAIDPYEITAPKDEVKLISHEDKRYYYCNIKTVNLLPSVIASTAAEEAGCDEALLHRNGTVTECAHSNFFIIKDGTLIGHPDGELILPGITGINLVKEARRLGIPVVRRPFTLAEVYSCDEALITSTTKFARRVCSLDGIAVGGKDYDRVSALCKSLYGDFCKKMEK